MTEANQSDNITRIRPAASLEKNSVWLQTSVVVLKGYGAGMEYIIDRADTKIGRNQRAHIQL